MMPRKLTQITVTARPYLLTYHGTGQTYPLTSEEAQRLIDEYPAAMTRGGYVVLQGHNTGRASERTTIAPATWGGGPAFLLTE
jgi:hypothetical protein